MWVYFRLGEEARALEMPCHLKPKLLWCWVYDDWPACRSNDIIFLRDWWVSVHWDLEWKHRARVSDKVSGAKRDYSLQKPRVDPISAPSTFFLLSSQTIIYDPDCDPTISSKLQNVSLSWRFRIWRRGQLPRMEDTEGVITGCLLVSDKAHVFDVWSGCDFTGCVWGWRKTIYLDSNKETDTDHWVPAVQQRLVCVCVCVSEC